MIILQTSYAFVTVNKSIYLSIYISSAIFSTSVSQKVCKGNAITIWDIEGSSFWKSLRRYILNSDNVLRFPEPRVVTSQSYPIRRERASCVARRITGSFDPDDLRPTYPGAGNIYSRAQRRARRALLEGPLELRESRGTIENYVTALSRGKLSHSRLEIRVGR